LVGRENGKNIEMEEHAIGRSAMVWPSRPRESGQESVTGGVMTVQTDSAEKLQEYAHPERLVTTAWLAAHLDDPDVVVVESDEDVLLYETGHIPGAVKVDWHTDLNDQVARDYVDGEGFTWLMSSR